MTTISDSGAHSSAEDTDRIPASKGPFTPGTDGYLTIAQIKAAVAIASITTYDNSGSGLTATDVQAAIDEIVASLGAAAYEDYEVGTFTPTIVYATPGTSSIAYQDQDGSYTRIGDKVFYSFFYPVHAD